jgi:hypothetical protein
MFSINLKAVIRDVITWHSTYLNTGKEADYTMHKYVVYIKSTFHLHFLMIVESGGLSSKFHSSTDLVQSHCQMFCKKEADSMKSSSVSHIF